MKELVSKQGILVTPGKKKGSVRLDNETKEMVIELNNSTEIMWTLPGAKMTV